MKKERVLSIRSAPTTYVVRHVTVPEGQDDVAPSTVEPLPPLCQTGGLITLGFRNGPLTVPKSKEPFNIGKWIKTNFIQHVYN